LSAALNTIWSRQDRQGVKKTIEITYESPTISHSFGDETRPIHAFLDWARRLGVTVEWQLDGFGMVTLDCSKRVPSAPPAVCGPVADVINKMASQAQRVEIKCGGSPLHHTWRHLLSFPKADELSIEEDFDNPPIDRTIKSIPTWLLEVGQDGNNVRLPAIDTFWGELGLSVDGRAHLPARPRTLTRLLGSLRHLTFVELSSASLPIVYECVSCTSVDKLDRVVLHVGPRMSALPEHISQKLPAVKYLSVEVSDAVMHDDVWRVVEGADALSIVGFVRQLRPHEAELRLGIHDDALASHDYGGIGGDELDEAIVEYGTTWTEALGFQCFQQVMETQHLTHASASCHTIEGEFGEPEFSHADLHLVFVAK